MKTYLVLALGLIFSVSLAAQRPVKSFYQDHKRLEGVRNYKVPGWLVWLGCTVARPFAGEPETKVGLKWGRKVKKMRLLIAEDDNPLPPGAVEDFVQNARTHRFADLFYVREGDTHINVMALDNQKGKIKELVILVDEPGSLVFIGLKTKIRYRDIPRLIDELIRAGEDEGEIDIQEPEPAEPPVAEAAPVVN